MSKKSAPIYPAYTFHDSKTWFNWVKLTAADVFALREEPGFEGQNVYFCLNHPIRYVCLTGAVLFIEDKFNKYTLIHLDDGSGKIITVKIKRLSAEIADTVDCPSNTEVSNVDVISTIGSYDVLVDKQTIDTGTIIKVKATIDTFRLQRQLELKRIWIVRSTAEEAAEWEEAAKFKSEVLGYPWVLSNDRMRELQVAELEKVRKREDSERREEKRRRYDVAKKAKRDEKRREHELRKELRRRKEEEAMNAGAII